MENITEYKELCKRVKRVHRRTQTISFLKEPFYIILFIVMLFFAVTFVAAYCWSFLTSVKIRSDYILNPFGFPVEFKFENYLTALSKLYVDKAVAGGGTERVFLSELFVNSFLYSTIIAFTQVFPSAVVGYISAKYRKLALPRFIHALVIFTMFVPISPSMATTIVFYRKLGIFDSFAGTVFVRFSFTSQFLLFYAFFKGFDSSYAEAAFMDGAGHMTVLLKIALPLASGQFWVLYMMQFIGCWGDWTWSYVYLPSMPTAALGLYKFQFSIDPVVSSVPYQMAGAILFSLPCLTLFILFRNKFMTGLTVGGIKG